MILLVWGMKGDACRKPGRDAGRASVHPVSNGAIMGGEIGGGLRMDSCGGTLDGSGWGTRGWRPCTLVESVLRSC